MELISDVVYTKEGPDVAQFAELVHHKTHGNPFFTISFLTNLYQTGLLVGELPSSPGQKAPYIYII